MTRTACALLTALFSLAPALLAIPQGSEPAEIYYVDASSGDDSADGLTPLTAWQHISFALDRVALPPDTPTPPPIRRIIVRDGFYSVSGGEEFPYRITAGVQLIGEFREFLPYVDGIGAEADAMLEIVSTAADVWPVDENTRIEKMFFAGNVSNALVVRSDSQPMTPVLEDVGFYGGGDSFTIHQSRAVGAGNMHPIYRNVSASFGAGGVRIENSSATWIDGFVIDNFGGHGFVVESTDFASSIEFRGGRIGFHSTYGVRLMTSGAGGTIDAVFSDCRIDQSNLAGLYASAEVDSRTTVTLERCTIDQNDGDGIRLRQDNLATVELAVLDSLLAQNSGAGLALSSSDGGVFAIDIVSTTVADNFAGGIDSSGSDALFDGYLDVRDSIVALNGDDLDYSVNPPISVSTSLVGDGEFAGQNGNVTGDPSFVDAEQSDYRLQADSPALETGAPDGGSGSETDINGSARYVDADLDTAETIDMGAFERSTLVAADEVDLGTPLDFTTDGAPGTMLLFAARTSTDPLDTVHGQFDLPLASVFSLGSFPTGSASLTVPGNPSLAGLKIVLQALLPSGLAPQGFAFSNTEALRIKDA